MPELNGTGPEGKGPMTGCGSGYCVIPLDTAEQEVGLLKDQEKALKKRLKHVETRIRRIENRTSKKDQHDEDCGFSQ